ncbi:hypothetical protein [Foetidibacter luteolus]|uniref:hypothetical protein n=1 Tax=Foetidibacter luteolus TaxID=2608880 RepID=UPI00129BCC23|nr:hypothetical protein [Foetidibacter luteolus]
MGETEGYTDVMEQAKTAETGQDNAKAIERYKRAIKMRPGSELPYKRLMILYRKERKYRQELAVLNKAISFFTKLYSPVPARKKRRKSIERALAQSLGLLNKSGKLLYVPEPLAGWIKRKEIVTAKITLQ